MTVHKLISPETTSKMLGVSTNTLRNWRCQKVNFHRHVKISSRVMYVHDEIESYIEGLLEARS